MPKLTLNRVFATSLFGLVAGLGLLFGLVFHGLQTALLKSAEQSRDRNAAIIVQSVSDYLSQAPSAVDGFETHLQVGFTKPSDPASLRNGLLAVLMENPDISEATFTYAKSRGFDKQGMSIIDPASVGQVTMFRAQKTAGFIHHFTWNEGGHFLSTRARVSLDGKEGAPEPAVAVADPSESLTFTTPCRKNFYGQLLWTDLHWSGIDEALPMAQRRVAVSVIKAVDFPAGHFAGVMRIGLFKDAIDHAIEMPATIDTANLSIFLCDSDGRLIALSGSNHYIVSGDDVRLSPAGAPAPILAALERPALRTVDDDHPLVSDQFVTSGTTYLGSFRSLPDTQSWIVGVIAPKKAYLEELLKIRSQVFWESLALLTVIAVIDGIVLKAVSAAHAVIVREAVLMNDFVLTSSKNSCRFHDINRVLASLERAKTAMRSMGKYVPMDLVRRLYHRGEEPCLGAETTELSVLFTDIQNFTAFAESNDADTVANRLGVYLETIASVIQREKGTIDKYIGDSVMAFWNAPEPVPGHPRLACRAALACREALRLLYASPAWEGLRGFETRFGLHHCTASVGHFGSPERFNYTAIGDGINLASRLQSLNKHYGTSIIASGPLRGEAGDGFLFRRLDRVAVKGKTQSLDIYELIGESMDSVPLYVSIYEQALDAWLQGDFGNALTLAESQPGDGPSRYLAARCLRYLADPPPAGWGGVYAFDSK